MAKKKMTVEKFRNMLDRQINFGGTDSQMNSWEEALRKSEAWPLDSIVDVNGAKASPAKDITYTSRVKFNEATEMSPEQLKKIRNQITANPAGVLNVKGLGWVAISSNTENVHHSFDTMKWDFKLGISNIKSGEKVFILPSIESNGNFAIMATAQNDAFPLSKATQDSDWK